MMVDLLFWVVPQIIEVNSLEEANKASERLGSEGHSVRRIHVYSMGIDRIPRYQVVYFKRFQKKVKA